MFFKNQLPVLSQLYSILEKKSRKLFRRNWYQLLRLPQHFRYHDSRILTRTLEQRFEQEVFHSRGFQIWFHETPTEIFFCRMNNFNEARSCFEFVLIKQLTWALREGKKSNCYSLPTLKNPIGYTFSKDHLFCHHIHEIKKHPKRHIKLSFRLEQNNKWLFSIKRFSQTANQFLSNEIVCLHHSEILKNFIYSFAIFFFVV